LRSRQSALVTSCTLLAERAEVLARERFVTRLRQAGVSARTMVEDYAAIALVIEPPPLTEPISRDPDDDEVLACALAAQADAIVSGDHDLLTLGSHRGIPILPAAQAVEMIATHTTHR
jgi:uncharacterized protein